MEATIEWDKPRLLSILHLNEPNTMGQRYNENHPAITTLLAILQEFTPKEKIKFLQFCTSMSRLLPNEQLSIRVFPRAAREPYARTCVYHLELPDYYEHATSPYLLAWDSCAVSEPSLVTAWEEVRAFAAKAQQNIHIHAFTCL